MAVRLGRLYPVHLPGVVPAGVTGPAGQVSPDEPVPTVAVAKEVSEGGPDVKPQQPAPLKVLERGLSPVLGKSYIVYAQKPVVTGAGVGG